MPNRVGHQRLTTLAAVTTLPLVCVMGSQGMWLEWGILEGGILLTLVPDLTPDLDISHRRFGWLGEFLGFRAYAELVPHRFGMRKRHWSRLRVWNLFLFSHIPLVGTLPRTILLCLPLLLLWLLLSLPYSPYLLYYFLWLWLGMSYSDCWHVAADRILSDFKETTKEFWRKRRRYGQE